jgi:hypothetical protein
MVEILEKAPRNCFSDGDCCSCGSYNTSCGNSGDTSLHFGATDTSTRKAADAAVKSATTLETALQTARENFRGEQRPVIWLSNQKGAPEFVINKTGDNTGQILWTWHFTNYGKTPALHITFRQFMNIENTVEESSTLRAG